MAWVSVGDCVIVAQCIRVSCGFRFSTGDCVIIARSFQLDCSELPFRLDWGGFLFVCVQDEPEKRELRTVA